MSKKYLIQDSNCKIKATRVKKVVSFKRSLPQIIKYNKQKLNFKNDENNEKKLYMEVKRVKKRVAYENRNDYGKIIANPNYLKSTPSIFKLAESNKINLNFSDNFLFKLSSFTVEDYNEKDESHLIVNNNNNNKVLKTYLFNNSNSSKGRHSLSSGIEPEVNNIDLKKVNHFSNTQSGCFVGENENLLCKNKEKSQDNSNRLSINNSAEFFETINKKALIFHLCHPCQFSFHGELKLTLIAGEVEILGYVLNEYSKLKTVDVYSPEFCTPLVVATKSGNKAISYDKIKSQLQNILSNNDFKELLSHLQPNDTVLMLEQISSTFGTVIYNYMDLPLFPKNLENFSSLSESFKAIQSTFKFNSINSTLMYKKNPEWDKIIINQCTVLCGGKGVGKSTLLKYYINKFICNEESVLVLDLDPGQPEFTPPGFVSAVIVKNPIIGPNFTHITEPILSLFFGSANTNDSPSKYLSCIEFLVEKCKNDDQLMRMKWIVNTMGFCKGLGVEIMISILKLINPDTVIQIRSSNDLNNYPYDLVSTVINQKSGFEMKNVSKTLTYRHKMIHSSAEIKNKPIKNVLTSYELRDLMLLSYFSQMLSPLSFNFNGVQPYKISFSKIFLAIEFLIKPNDVLKAFNGSIVSFSHFEQSTEIVLSNETEKNYFKIVLKPEISSSSGLGLIRGIDCERKIFYVITPVSSEILREINCFTLGKLYPPSALYLKQESVRMPTVYTTLSTRKAVEKVKKKFRQ